MSHKPTPEPGAKHSPVGFRSPANLVYPPTDWAGRFWKIGVEHLEFINIFQGSPMLDEFLLDQILTRRDLLRPILNQDCTWWVSDAPPCFEPTASSYFEAIFRRMERLLRYALYAGRRFTPVDPDSLSAIPGDLDYELATEFVRHRVTHIDLALAVSGLRREVISNMGRPMCSLSWERPCVGEWRYKMWMEVFLDTPPLHWELDHQALIVAIRAPQDAERELPRVFADPETRAVYLDGREVASHIPSDVFQYVSAVIAAHPRPITFRAMQPASLRGKNQTRLRKKMAEHCRRLAELIGVGSEGHFLNLPSRE